MNDTIYRQAAIDALKAMAVPRHLDVACEDIWERDRTLDNAIDVMRGLPSAEPEIIKCKDCLMHGVCRFEQGLGLDGYCSQAERRN